MKFYIHVNSAAWAHKNQLKFEKVHFLSEMREIFSRWVTFNLLAWAVFKSVVLETSGMLYSSEKYELKSAVRQTLICLWDKLPWSYKQENQIKIPEGLF